MRCSYLFGISFCLTLLASQINIMQTQADTILVPEYTDSIEYAIDISKPGDIISIAKRDQPYYAIMNFANTELTMKARSTTEFPKIDAYHSININNASVTIEGFFVYASIESTINIINSDVILHRLEVHGGDRLYIPNHDGYTASPTVRMRDSENKSLLIRRSKLLGGNGNYTEESSALLIKNCTSSVVTIQDSEVRGAKRERTWLLANFSPFSNSAICVSNSSDIELNCETGEIWSQDGYDAKVTRPSWITDPALPDSPSDGTSVVIIDHSSILIDSLFGVAGNGGDGGIITAIISETEEVQEFYDGGNGGSGLHALNGSYVKLRNCDLLGGEGGLPNGLPGENYVSDETSTIEFINDSDVNEWQLY